MKKILFVLLFSAFGLASCNKEPEPLTKEQIKQKVDSITSIRVKESDERAKTDLERRIKIEVKVKADSMLNAQLNGAKDTARPVVIPGGPRAAFPGNPVIRPNK